MAVDDGKKDAEIVEFLLAQLDEAHAALRGVIRVADRKTTEFDAARKALEEEFGKYPKPSGSEE